MTFKGPIQQIVPLLEKLVPLVVSVPLPNADIGLVLGLVWSLSSDVYIYIYILMFFCVCVRYSHVFVVVKMQQCCDNSDGIGFVRSLLSPEAGGDVLADLVFREVRAYCQRWKWLSGEVHFRKIRRWGAVHLHIRPTFHWSDKYSPSKLRIGLRVRVGTNENQ